MDAFNYLIVSDLHLRGGFNNPTLGLYHFDEEFADFLRYYRLHRGSNRPWHLVIGGDFIEFLYITDRPDPNERMLKGCTFLDSEYRYGAGTEPPKSRWKLDRILRSSHPQLLLALARFVAEGNSISILRGNHDSEMFWPEVQEHFRRLIAEHHPVDVSYMAMKEAVAARVQFPEWFLYVPELLYVEHGCQYDPFCCFQYFLNPVVPEHPTLIQMSIGELSIRYFTNQMKMINAMAAENIKSVSEYVWWVLRGNLKVMPRTFRLYVAMVRRVLAKSGRPDPQAESSVRAEHERRVAAFDAHYGLPQGTATAVDAMRATPVMRYPFAMARFLALDLIVGALALALAAVAVVVWYPARVGLLALVAALAAGGSIAYIGALRFRRVTEAAQLNRTAERIAQLFRVPYVVFGHSHGAGNWRLPGGSSYVNVGTWVPEGEAAYFVYFVAEGDGASPSGRLWRWNKAKREPEPFEGSNHASVTE
ncbi:MAG TPA: hypothetical protein VMW56_17455 [Candidatus Margulisiibacteriota bacterium]|nr:hypothetical protein [Candidatus Margulisiibacteriota bacterium]